MKTLLLLSFVSALGAFSLACGAPPDTLTNESEANGTIAGNDAEREEAEDEEPARSTSQNRPAQSQTNTSETGNTRQACDPKAAETAAECATCCAEQAAPTQPAADADDCACGANGTCADACADTAVCGGSGFSISCATCLFQEKCVPGGGNLDLGNAGKDATACFQICEAKP